MLVSWVEMPRSPGHAFYDKLQGVLIAAGFDRFIETHGLAPLTHNREVLSDFLERSVAFTTPEEAEALLERLIQLRPDQVVRRPHGERHGYAA